MENYNIKYNEVLNRIVSVRGKETRNLFLSGFMRTLSFLLIFILVISLIEMLANGDEVFRTILMVLMLISSIVAGVILLNGSLVRLLGLRKSSIESIALRIGNAYPELKDRLCNGIQLIKNLSMKTGTSPVLAVEAFGNVSEDAASKDFGVIINKKETKKSLLYFLSIFFITVLLLGIFHTSLGAAFYRVMNFNESFLPPAPFSLSIKPEKTSVLRGTNVILTVTAKGTAPEKVILYIREKQQEQYDSYTLQADSDGVYKYEIPSIRQSIVFYAESPWLNTSVKSGEGTVNVVDKPSIRSMTGKLTYPSYTKLTARAIDEQSADIAALKGSVVSLQVISNKELSTAKIVIENDPNISLNTKDTSTSLTVVNNIKIDTNYVAMKTDGKKAYGSFRVSRNGNYYISIKDKNGENNSNPIKYSIVALNDDYPSISLVSPTMDIQVTEEALLPIRVSISDDYGFSGLKLFYRLTQSQYVQPDQKFTSINIPVLTNENTADIPYLWNLNKINIAPEDRYEFYLEVYDNDIVSGPKSARTQTLSLRLPSLDEVLKDADKSQDKLQKDLQNVLKQAEDVKKDMDELNKEMLKNEGKKEMDWKEKKSLQDIQKKQEAIRQKLSDVQKNIEDVTKRLQENNALSPETLAKYQELQKLLQDVNSPELRKLQEKMQQMLESIPKEQLQKAMEEAKFNEENFRKSIERTIKILKRLQAEQKVDALTKRAEELQQKQEDLQNKLNNTNPNDENKRKDLAEQQKNLKKDLNDIGEDLKDLEKLMKEIGDEMPMDELNKAKQELSQNETSQDMQEASESTENGQFNKAQQSQSSASKKLQKFTKQMKKLKEEMDKKITKEAIKKMQKAISNMLELSKKQEQLKSKTSSADYNSTQIPKYAEEQQNMEEALGNIANSLIELSQKTFAVTPEMGKEIGDALNSMRNAISKLSEMQTLSASQEQGKSMTAMNNAIIQMQNMLSQIQSSGSCNNPGGSGEGQGSGQNQMGGSFSQRLQQLASQQQSINQAMQQLGEHGKLSQEEQAKLNRIAGEQGKAQKTLEELANEQKKYPQTDRKTLGDIEKIAQEMKEVVSDMKSSNINDQTLKRQERILSRLLDATKSIHDRDYEKTRESKTGKEFNRQSPGEIDLSTQEGRNKALQDLLRSIQEGYTKDYENLIRMYFESIQNGN
ncbi:MAG: hypothetical protein EPN82_08330 [Bacteroidetes bacterium]|nr:MAG: hypothetical protein EPN82_08330 [Bacteroidota bacterium]